MLCELLKERDLPELKSRGEMLEILLREEYGSLPKKPDRLEFKVEEDTLRNFCAGKAKFDKITATLEIDGKEFSFPFVSMVPRGGGKHPFFVNIGFTYDRSIPNKYLPVEEIIDNGFGILFFHYTDVTSDSYAYEDGLGGLALGSWNRKPDDPGKIALWAYAAQRLLDYAYTREEFDTDRAIVCGHSRLGKTALLAGATDERFKYVYSNDSGCGGAAITRGKVGETFLDMSDCIGYWFCKNFNNHVGHESEMPFDQHYLLASCAPRYVYVASAVEDTWADPNSEYLSCVAASGAWEKDGFISEDRFPVAGDVFHDGKIGYHLRAGCHYFSREDWLKFIAFFRKKEAEEMA